MRIGVIGRLALGITAILAAAPAYAAPVDGGVNFQTPATEIAQEVMNFHDFVLIIITAITVFVTGLLMWVMIRYNKKANPTPKTFSHNTTVEVLWTVIPVLILIAIAFKSFPLLYDQDVFPTERVLADGSKAPITEDEIVDIKVYGRQWFWSYMYGDDEEGVEFDSNMVPDDLIDAARGQIPKLSVDNPLVAPAGKYVRLTVTASDVIHAWAMPAFAIKIDAVPGRINQLWFRADTPGAYYGQCSELCGTRHAYMPIELRILPQEQYDRWHELAATSMSQARAYLDEVQPLGGRQVAER